MGYYSSVYVRGVATISSKLQEFTAQELAERKLFEAEAKARGYDLSSTGSSRFFELVKAYLKYNDSNFGYFFAVEETDDPSVISLVADGESGKAYELDEELKDFVRFLSDNDLMLNARIYRSGEENGDLERWVVKDNEIERAEAELRFPDGEVAS